MRYRKNLTAGKSSCKGMARIDTVMVRTACRSVRRCSVGNAKACSQDIPGNQGESYSGSAKTTGKTENADLEKGFVKAFNKLVTDREKYMEIWQQMKSDGTPLEKIRAGQMMEAVGNEPLTRFVPEIAQLVLCEVTVLGAKKYEFFFLEGSRVKVSV